MSHEQHTGPDLGVLLLERGIYAHAGLVHDLADGLSHLSLNSVQMSSGQPAPAVAQPVAMSKSSKKNKKKKNKQAANAAAAGTTSSAAQEPVAPPMSHQSAQQRPNNSAAEPYQGYGAQEDDDLPGLDDIDSFAPGGAASSLAAAAQAAAVAAGFPSFNAHATQSELLATANDLYRQIESAATAALAGAPGTNGRNGVEGDDQYWQSLPAHLRSFIKNALPLAAGLSPGVGVTASQAGAAAQALNLTPEQMHQAAQQLAQVVQSTGWAALGVAPPAGTNGQQQMPFRGAAVNGTLPNGAATATIPLGSFTLPLPLHPHPDHPHQGSNDQDEYLDDEDEEEEEEEELDSEEEGSLEEEEEGESEEEDSEDEHERMRQQQAAIAARQKAKVCIIRLLSFAIGSKNQSYSFRNMQRKAKLVNNRCDNLRLSNSRKRKRCKLPCNRLRKQLVGPMVLQPQLVPLCPSFRN